MPLFKYKKLGFQCLSYALVVALLVVAFYGLTRSIDPDLFARLAVGQLIVENGAVPTQDVFSFSPKKDIWIDHEWLSGVVFFLIQQVLGSNSLFLLNIAIAAVVMFLIFAQLFDSSKRARWLIFFICLVETRYLWSSPIRSQAFTYLFSVIYLVLLARIYKTQKPERLWVLPVLMLPWVNLHGGFVVGLGLLALFSIGLFFEKKRAAGRLLITTGLCLLVTAVNPYGLVEYWSYLIAAVTMDRPDVQEWNSLLSLDDRIILPLTIMGFMLAGYLKRQQRKLLTARNLLLIGTFVYGLTHSRLIAIFIFTFCVFGIEYFDTGIEALPKKFRELWVRACWSLRYPVLVAAVVLALRFGFYSEARTFVYSKYPVAAAQWLLSQRPAGGRLLVGFNWGSYCLWKMHPSFLVSIDGRYEELYTDRTYHLNKAAFGEELGLALKSVKELNPDYILVDRAASKRADFGDSWRGIFEDEQSAIFERVQKR